MINTWKCLLFGSVALSTFCSIIYDAVWTRLAFSNFGSTVSMLTVVMMSCVLGALIGAWAGGRWIGNWCDRFKASPMTIFAVLEALAGMTSLAVPFLFQLVSDRLTAEGASSLSHFSIVSGFLVFAILFPIAFAKGTGVSTVTEYAKRFRTSQTHTFSFLFTAISLGASLAVLFTWGFFIELYGFHFTLAIGAALNFIVSVTAIGIGRRFPVRKVTLARKIPDSFQTIDVQKASLKKRFPDQLVVLFVLGSAAAAMQVVLMRGFDAITESSVYATAFNLLAYFVPVWLGAQIYRNHLAKDGLRSVYLLLSILGVSAFFPIIFSDAVVGGTVVWMMLSLIPFYGAIGYLVPMLIDSYSDAEAPKVGVAYALHLTGGLVGGSLVCYLILPYLGVKGAIAALSLPVFAMIIRSGNFYQVSLKKITLSLSACAFSLVLGVFVFSTFEESGSSRVVSRDPASVSVLVSRDAGTSLLVNGVKYASADTSAKLMGHLPVALYSGQPKTALLLGVGTGDTLRSLRSWGLQVSAVEELASITNLQKAKLGSAGPIIHDDPRRFLARTDQAYDIVVVEPPPQAEMATASLLYSEEFYRLVKNHLAEAGIVHQWIPEGEITITEAVIHSLVRSFPYLRVFRSNSGGLHFLASRNPIVVPALAELAERVPEPASKDLLEYEPNSEWAKIFGAVIENPVDISILGQEHEIRITDDMPMNEYYFLRRSFPSYFVPEGQVSRRPKVITISRAELN